jgi:hypothetical protein
MARRWWKSGQLKPGIEIKEPGSILAHDRQWKIKMAINSFGAVCTATVMVVFGVTKFKEGAWIIIILTPLLVGIFFTIHRHYKNLARQLSLDHIPSNGPLQRNRVVLLISGVHQGTLAALRYAKSLSTDVTALHISIDPPETEKVISKWEMYGDGYRLAILQSPYRLIIEPLLEYLAYLEDGRQRTEVITIVAPTFVPKDGRAGLLHMRTAETLRKVLRSRNDIVIIEVPYQVD